MPHRNSLNEDNPTPSSSDRKIGSEVKNGKLLSGSEKSAVKRLQKLWDAQDSFFDKHFAQWKVNVLRHMGYPNVALTHHGSDGWDYYIPPNTTPDNVPMISKLSDTIRKLTAVLFADPPAPHVEPFSNTDDEVQAAQIARRVLESVESEAMLSEVTKMRRAFMKASDYGSGFIYYYVDPRGGGKQPIQVEAHPAAQNVKFALNHPETGQPLPPPYVKRYVRPDGTLTDNRSEAALRDVPILKSRILTGRNLRFVPHNSEDLWDADGVLIGEFITWGRLKNMFPEKLGKVSDEKKDSILQYRPSRADDIAAYHQDLSQNTQNDDEKLVWVLTAFFGQTSDYPEGAFIMQVGNEMLLHRGKWSHKREDGTLEVLDVPVTQYAQWNEGRDNPYSVGTSELIGRGEEFRVAQMTAILDHLERLNNRKIFVNVHSIVNESDLFSNKRVIRTHGDAPEYEDVPTVPSAVVEWTDRYDVLMDQAIGLGDTTAGLENPSVKSGRHALAIVQQAHASLSELRQNIIRAYERSGRIKLQLIRKFFKNPQELGWTTDEDEFRMETWSRVDLGNSRDVRVRSGTMTMLTPVAKAQLAEHYFAMGMLDQFQTYDIFEGALGATLGIEDDPIRLRIKRQISEWKKGPPEGWTPADPVEQPVVDPATGQPVVDPATGQPVTEQVQPPDPYLENIWESVPADSLPGVAQIRLNEISKLMASKKYLQHHPVWRSRVEQEFEMMAQAAAPPAQPGQGGATPEQAAQQGSPGQQTQAQDLAGLGDTALSPGQGQPALNSGDIP